MNDGGREGETPAALDADATALARLHALSDRRVTALAPLVALPAMSGWLSRAEAVLPNALEASRAAEWLLDNAYVVERAVRQIREDLPSGYYARLRALALEDDSRPPRVYAVARGIANATSLQLTAEAVTRFVSAYQRVETLDLAELWALPTMLRLVCIELLVCAMERLCPQLPAPFETDLHEEVSEKLDDTECVARCIRGLVTLDAVPWIDFVEATSAIDAVLRRDPSGDYSRMDVETRDRYRRRVEELARRSHHDEREVARRALALARRAEGSDRSGHVGFWLVDEGRTKLERALRFKPGGRERIQRALRAHATAVYLGALCLLTGLFLIAPIAYLAAVAAHAASYAIAFPLLLLPASTLAVTVLHRTLSALLPPTPLPKLDFSRGIPEDHATAVAIPGLLGSREDVEHLLRQIERHALANGDRNLRFVLLTCFPEADGPRRPEDAALLEQAVRGIGELNRRHAPDGRGPFHLLHRERRFNAAEGRWMGWERKRGKLDEFNRILLGATDTTFEVHEGNPAGLERIRYVITLDSDTALPHGTAARLVATLAHPLNRAVVDPASGRVRAGYTVVQPRVETSPESGNRSLFTRLFCGDTAIDIYSRAVSDVYQDLFGSGIYVGKAIYDVASFSKSLEDRVPENALVSHDLFEGIHGRTALASDIVLYEDYPASYPAFSRRLHRWVRGDWQLVPWLRASVPSARSDHLPNRLAWIDRWKIVDNLRRSLIPSAILLLLVSGWTWLPGSPLVWTLLAILAPAGALFTDAATGILRERGRIAPQHSKDLGRWVLLLVFLPHQAAVTVDAIVRALFRLTITKRRLLEWTTSAQVATSVARGHSATRTWSEMAMAPLVAIATGAALLAWRPSALPIAAPILVAWAASPEIARRISTPRSLRRESLAEADVEFLRSVARRTWLYFETFVGPDGHWLPPDNYQEDPGRVIAHRTSPTNIGMLLLSTLAAYDLGYVGLDALVLRLRHTLRTVTALEHYRGHLFNWYHTRTLEPLLPRYVSAVDSGNLAAALIAIESAAARMGGLPCLRSERWQGLADAVALLRSSLSELLRGDETSRWRESEQRTAAIHERVLDARHQPGAWTVALRALDESCSELDRALVDALAEHGFSGMTALREVRLWLARVHDHIRGMQREVEFVAPWLYLLEAPPRLPEAHPSAATLSQICDRLADLLSPQALLDTRALRCEEASDLIADAREQLDAEGRGAGVASELSTWLDELEKAISVGGENARQLDDDLGQLAAEVGREVLGMDFGLLYDPQVRHLYIGYNVTADQMDSHHYDLLASEARLTSLVAIAKGDLPVEHWFSLGRPLTRVEGGIALLSWGGTMFEYLMPPLLVRSEPGTLLAESQRAAVLEQMAVGDRLNLPWGVSESGFAAFDADRNYQYRAFGVQGLGRKRGLEADRVVAPYASALALPWFPSSAVQNLKRLQELGALATYGFHEAVDFTPARLPEGRDYEIVCSHMSHHQGMILAAIDNLLCDDALVERFEADARVQAAGLLLQERVPERHPVEERPIALAPVERPRSKRPIDLRPWHPDLAIARPSVHLLGNGRLASRLTETGAGGIRWREHAVTRFVPDPTLDDSGLWIHVRDQETGAIWSVGRQPTDDDGAEVDVIFHAHMAELHRRQHGVALRTDIAIGTADDIEVRRVTIVNETDRPRSLSFTSYGEVVLAPPRDDARHPAFSKLFVEGTYVPSLDALLFMRRPRDPDEHFPLVMHRLVADSPSVTFAGFETDRERFLERHGSRRRPRGLEADLARTQGATLDPIMALRADVKLAPYATEQLAFVTIVAPSRQAVERTAVRHETIASIEWLLSDAHAEAGRELARLGLEAARLPELQALLSALLAPSREPRAGRERPSSSRLGQPDLWGLGISGDDPILLVETADGVQGSLLADLFRAHQLWRTRGMAVDLVVLSGSASGYRDDAWEDVHRLLRKLGTAEWLGRRAGIHLVRADQVSDEQRRLLEVSAGVVLDAQGEPLRVQLARREHEGHPLPRLEATRAAQALDAAPALERPGGLLFDNGLGGFSPDGREYVIHLRPGRSTPAPWCNVIANDDFGCLVTEAGGGYSWAGNSGEFRLTPWTNDPVLDPPGESLYLRDEETVEVWTPTPGPAGFDLPCQIRHGAGYSDWRQSARSLGTRVRVFVPIDDPVKIVELHVTNHESRPRRITATYYARWLLGRAPEDGASHVVVDYDAPTRSLRARNRWNPDFADRVAFLTADREPHGYTADRTEFLGHAGDASAPAALRRVGLAGTVGSGLDPCGAFQVHLDLAAGQTVRTHFVLGAGRDEGHAAELAHRWRQESAVTEAFSRLAAHWDTLFSTLTVQTPEPAMDLLINRWALYQALSSRLLARTGFYQSSGAFGFRDQLQDVLALLHCEPQRTRDHILESASRQFEEGDVLHWWHPPLGRGVRTRCSDDLLWLPYVTARYVEATGDLAILDEEVPFLSAPALRPEEHERYELFRHGGARGSLFEHCRRALERGLTSGPRGLPLMGDGDWNDGMNRVGSRGRGESVWLGWFAGTVASDFAALCERRGESESAGAWRERARATFAAVEKEGWDGEWYRRAFDDDGRPWGSATSEECRIDSIAQAWAVLSGGASRERREQALRSARSALIREHEQLVCLLWPPFGLTARDPGYIRAYPPGIRENGGQYSHAAAWLGWAFAEAGDAEDALRVFRMLNPIERTESLESVRRYRLEPYALAADIASVEPHVGRGGWSWYTGTAAWCWRLGVEAILGLRRVGGSRLRIEPRLPHHWPGFRATIRTEGGVLEIVVENARGLGEGATEVRVDGMAVEGSLVDLPRDGATRHVMVRCGA